MKISVNKQQNSLTFIPESSLDFYHLGVISSRIAHLTITTHNTDNPKPQLKEFNVSVQSLMEALLKVK